MTPFMTPLFASSANSSTCHSSTFSSGQKPAQSFIFRPANSTTSDKLEYYDSIIEADQVEPRNRISLLLLALIIELYVNDDNAN